MPADHDTSIGEHDQPVPPPEPIARIVNSLASYSRWFFLLAVAGTAIIAITLFIYGFIFTFFILWETFTAISFEVHALKDYISISIEIIDLFLVATVFYITSLGLYELFIAKAPLPGWVKIHTLDDLKVKLLGLIIIALAVLFLQEALAWSGSVDFWVYGFSIGFVIAAISAYLYVKH